MKLSYRNLLSISCKISIILFEKKRIENLIRSLINIAVFYGKKIKELHPV